MKIIFYLFSKKYISSKIVFLVATIIFDLITIISYSSPNTEIPVSLFILLIGLNIISAIGTILGYCLSVVPNVVGLDINEAISSLKKEGLHYSLICDPCFVTEQIPKANSIVRRGKKVKLKVAKLDEDGNVQPAQFAIDEISSDFLEDLHRSFAYADIPFFNKKRMTITDDENGDCEVAVLCSFEFLDNHHEYLIYCEDDVYERKKGDLFNFSVARVIRKNRETILDGVEDENDWARIRTMLRYMARDKDPLRSIRLDSNGDEII